MSVPSPEQSWYPEQSDSSKFKPAFSDRVRWLGPATGQVKVRLELDSVGFQMDERYSRLAVAVP